MRISMLAIVNRTVAVRNALSAAIKAAENGEIIVTIGLNMQDEAMAHAVKAAVLAELEGRLSSIDRDLRSYGVVVDSGG